MTPEIYQFIASPIGDWMEIPGTWLECNPHGQIRDQRTKEWFGEVLRFEDFGDVLTGRIPVYLPNYVNPSKSPRNYFEKRTTDDREYNIQCIYQFAIDEQFLLAA